MAFWCAYNVLAPVTKTIWRGKGGTPEMFACDMIVPITSVLVTSIYCIHSTCDS